MMGRPGGGALVTGTGVKQQNLRAGLACIAMLLLHGIAVAKEYSKPPTELVHWPLPWARGVSLDYSQSSESIVEKKGVGNSVQSTGVVRVRIEDANADGFVQKWTTLEESTKYEQVRDSGLLYMQELAARLRRMPLDVKLRADGTYAGIRNLDHLQAHASVGNEALAEQALGTPGTAGSAGLQSGIKKVADLLSSRDFTEMRVSVLPTVYNFAASGGLGLDHEYTYQDQGPNLAGGEPFPMTGRMTLRRDELHAGWMMLEWTVGIDREQGGAILASASRTLLGDAFMAAAGKDAEMAIVAMAHNIDIGSSTRFRIDPKTGIVQWMQTVQRKRIGDHNEVQTTTLSLRTDAYSAGAALAGMALSGDVQDCVDTRADTAVVILACTTLLESRAVGESLRAVAYLERGRAHARREELDDAIRNLEAGLGLAPDNASGYGLLGRVQGRKGDLHAAIASFDRAIALDPASFDWWMNRGSAHESMREYPLAIQDYTRAVQISPDAALGWGGRCWARAVAATELEAALDDCNRAIALDALDANHLNSRGFVLFRLGRLQASITDYDGAVAARPEIASSFYIRGLAKTRMGHADEGLRDHARAVAIEPGIVERFMEYGVKP